MKRFLIIVTVIILLGCGNGYFFETKATYQAEASNLKVDVIATGHILDNDDLTDDGLATGIITSIKFSDTIYFKANTRELITLSSKKYKINNPATFITSLETCFDKIGYLTYNKKEVEELVNVIQSTAYGPKGTFVEEQPNLIKIVHLNIETNRGYGKKNE